MAGLIGSSDVAVYATATTTITAMITITTNESTNITRMITPRTITPNSNSTIVFNLANK